MLDILFRSWFQNAAKQKLYEAVAGAAKQHASQAASSAEQQAQVRERPCDVGLVFALGIELGGFEDLLEGALTTRAGKCSFRQGGLRGRHVVAVETGVGREAAAEGTRLLLAAHKPAWIVSAGFAGALQPQLKRGDIVMIDGVKNLAGEELAVDLKIPPEALAKSRGVHVGKLLTADKLLRLAAEKRELGVRHQALAVDMETYAVAEVCRQEKVRFLGVRVISDAVDDELSQDVDRLLKQKSTAGMLGAAVGSIARRPGSVKDMLALKETALVCSDKLAKFLAGVIEQLATGGRMKAEG